MKIIRQIENVGDIVKVNRKGTCPILKPRFYSKRLREIFSDISLEYSHPNDVDIFERDMRVIVSGFYDNLGLSIFIRHVKS